MFAPRLSGATAHIVGGTFAARQLPAYIARLATGSSRSGLGFSFRGLSESTTSGRKKIDAPLPVEGGITSIRSGLPAPSSSLVPGRSSLFDNASRASTSPILVQTRFFSSSTIRSLRESYFRRPNGRSSSSGYGRGGPGGGGGPGWFGNFRRRLDALNPMWVVYGLIGTNVAIFMVWQYAQASWSRFRDPTLYQWMSRNFIVSEANLAAGRIHTLLTCCFSHSNTSHIALNMLGLYFIGPATAGLLGPASFLGLYLGGGIVSSTVSLLWHRMMSNNRSKNHGSEGASGAIYASLAYYAAMFPQAQFLLFFIVPLPAWAAVGGIFAYDLYSSIRSPVLLLWFHTMRYAYVIFASQNAVTDSAGHVGGLLAGVAYAFWSKGRGGPRFRGRW